MATNLAIDDDLLLEAQEIGKPAQGLAFGDGNLHCATNVLTRGR